MGRTRRTRTADPLAVFVEAHRRTLPTRRGARRFNAGEHLWLGGRGAELACLEAQRRGAPDFRELFAAIPRREGRDRLDYGELVALSGDFYETPEALFEEKPSSAPWLWEENDLSDLRDIFGAELRWIEERQKGATGTVYPDNDIRLWWNAKAYVDLALRNDDHFGWRNVLAYCRHHAEALRLAREAAGRDDEGFRRALYTNAFADHFLTDGFAAGHIRVPRAEIRAWAGEVGYGEKLAGALSKVIHDQDGHVDESSLHGSANENGRAADDGLRVCNARGASWHARCDGQLFLLPGSQASPAVSQAVEAVAASVGELLQAWRRGTEPPGTYQATELVPFPHPELPPLPERFPAAMAEERFQALLASVAWYARIPWITGLQAEHLRALLQALPALMERFRQAVRSDVETKPEVARRIAPGYLTAFREIA